MRTITRTAVQGSFADDAVKPPCSIELLTQATAAANRLAPGRVLRIKELRRCADLFISSPLLCVASCVFVPACGRGRELSSGAAPPPETTPAAKKIKVGLVTDIGGLNDRAFNQLANKGLERAKNELGVERAC